MCACVAYVCDVLCMCGHMHARVRACCCAALTSRVHAGAPGHRGRSVDVLHGCTVGDAVLALQWDSMDRFLARPIDLRLRGLRPPVRWPSVRFDDAIGRCVLANVSSGAGLEPCAASAASPGMCCVCGGGDDACGGMINLSRHDANADEGGAAAAAAARRAVLDARVGTPFTIYDSCMHWATAERRRMALYEAAGWGALWTSAALRDVAAHGRVTGHVSDGAASDAAVTVAAERGGDGGVLNAAVCAEADGTGRACRLRARVSAVDGGCGGDAVAAPALLAHALDEIFQTFVVPPAVGRFGLGVSGGAARSVVSASAPYVLELVPEGAPTPLGPLTRRTLPEFDNGVEYALLVYTANCDVVEHYALGRRLILLNASRCGRVCEGVYWGAYACMHSQVLRA